MLRSIVLEENDNMMKEINTIKEKIDNIEKKIDDIINILLNEVKGDCKKMGDHIDFVEKVYDNVKNPLGFICNKINYFSKDNKDYTLTDTEPIELLSNDDINDILLENQSKETGQ